MRRIRSLCKDKKVYLDIMDRQHFQEMRQSIGDIGMAISRIIEQLQTNLWIENAQKDVLLSELLSVVW